VIEQEGAEKTETIGFGFLGSVVVLVLRLDAKTFVAFPKLVEFQQVTLKVLRLGRTGQAFPHQRGGNGGHGPRG
jgi:hypothetical protein